MFKIALALRHKIGTGTLLLNYFTRTILRINKTLAFPIHFTSRVSQGENLTIIDDEGDLTLYKCLGLSGGLYIQAKNIIKINSSVHIGPGAKIISANHDKTNLKAHEASQPIFIGKKVWIGSNAIILPGCKIGDGTIIGAGSVVTSNLPENCIAYGSPAKVAKYL